MSIRNRKDFWSAVMFVLFGVLFIIWSRDYQFGTAQRMGPGYFPTVLGYMLVFLGALVGLPALRRWPKRPMSAASAGAGSS